MILDRNNISYLVEEVWEPIDHTNPNGLIDAIIVADERVVIDKGSTEENRQFLDVHLRRRFEYITTKRLLHREIENTKFRITVKEIVRESGIVNEKVISTYTESDYPVPEHLKNGFYLLKIGETSSRFLKQ